MQPCDTLGNLWSLRVSQGLPLQEDKVMEHTEGMHPPNLSWHKLRSPRHKQCLSFMIHRRCPGRPVSMSTDIQANLNYARFSMSSFGSRGNAGGRPLGKRPNYGPQMRVYKSGLYSVQVLWQGSRGECWTYPWDSHKFHQIMQWIHIAFSAVSRKSNWRVGDWCDWSLSLFGGEFPMGLYSRCWT